MIAIDTNVLLRYLLQDDSAQSVKATNLILGSESILLTDVVLTETIWTLKGKRYNLSKAQIINVIYALFSEPNIKFEDSFAVWAALKYYMKEKSTTLPNKSRGVGFTDCLIVNKALRFISSKNEVVSTVYTFDKGALTLSGTKEPDQ